MWSQTTLVVYFVKKTSFMEKRFQVFVSSTYTDLINERNEVMQALLELECMPAGMELFPASNETQWSWIKKVIDESDYYIVIIAGRYGTIHPTMDISYTEMEYRYALEINKPIIGFLHENPMGLPKNLTESLIESEEKLSAFRNLVQSKLCKFYSSPADLGAKVSRSITQLKKQYPAIGWIRADKVATNFTDEDYFNLLKENTELKKEILENNRLVESKNFAGGNDGIVITLGFEHNMRNPENTKGWIKQSRKKAEIETTWDELFILVASQMFGNANNFNIFGLVIKSFQEDAVKLLHEKYDFQDNRFSYPEVENEALIMHQFRILGLIEISSNNTWRLTSYGILYFNNLIAVKKGEHTLFKTDFSDSEL